MLHITAMRHPHVKGLKGPQSFSLYTKYPRAILGTENTCPTHVSVSLKISGHQDEHICLYGIGFYHQRIKLKRKWRESEEKEQNDGIYIHTHTLISCDSPPLYHAPRSWVCVSD